jgi:hypothetical protein
MYEGTDKQSISSTCFLPIRLDHFLDARKNEIPAANQGGVQCYKLRTRPSRKRLTASWFAEFR